MPSTIPRSRLFDPAAAEVPAAGVPTPGFDASSEGSVFAELDSLTAEQNRVQSSGSALASMLAGARSLTPILEAVVFSPGVNASQEDMQHAVETMLHASNTITERAMQTLEIEDTEANNWAKGMLHQLAVGGVSAQWKHSGHADPSSWLDIIDRIVLAGVTERKQAYPDVADQTAYQVSHFAALSTIASEVRRFSFFIDHNALLEHLSRLLDEHIAKATTKVLEGVDASDADYLMVEQGFLKHGSRLFAEIYRSEAENTEVRVSGMTEPQRHQFLEAREPQQCILRINTAFTNLFSTLTRTSRLRAIDSTQRSLSPNAPSLS